MTVHLPPSVARLHSFSPQTPSYGSEFLLCKIQAPVFVYSFTFCVRSRFLLHFRGESEQIFVAVARIKGSFLFGILLSTHHEGEDAANSKTLFATPRKYHQTLVTGGRCLELHECAI